LLHVSPRACWDIALTWCVGRVFFVLVSGKQEEAALNWVHVGLIFNEWHVEMFV